MRRINRIIPERHVQSVIDGILHFSPCKTFVDLFEFRFGHCWQSFLASQITGKSDAFDQCIRNSFNNQQVQQRIDRTAITCWSFNNESPYMWEVYARSQPAIMLTAMDDDLLNYVKSKKREGAHTGDVTYHWKESFVRPKTTTVIHDSKDSEEFWYFFHKHEFYEFENEFRAVIFGEPGSVELQMPDGMVKGITLPPPQLPSLAPSLVKRLKERFGNLVQPSTLSWSSKLRTTASLDDYLLDKETPKTEEMIRLAEKRKHLQEQTRGWNDPKVPTVKIVELMGQIKEVEKQLKRSIEALEKDKGQSQSKSGKLKL